MKELAVKLFIVGKINEWIRKRILEEEITGKGKKGVEKLQNILDEYVRGIVTGKQIGRAHV